jgi:hypothetical protein
LIAQIKIARVKPTNESQIDFAKAVGVLNPAITDEHRDKYGNQG